MGVQHVADDASGYWWVDSDGEWEWISHEQDPDPDDPAPVEDS